MTDNKDKIHIIATGGTIDCLFSPKEYKPVPRPESGIVDFIESYIKPRFNITPTTVSMIDSLYMTDDIRKDIAVSANKSKSKFILITHGTDGMIDTAKFLEDHIEDIKKKTIILVGAMIPLIGFSPSDAGFNLGFALGNMKHLESGIYICMNGEVFTPHNVQKNLDESRFEHKDDS